MSSSLSFTELISALDAAYGGFQLPRHGDERLQLAVSSLHVEYDEERDHHDCAQGKGHAPIAVFGHLPLGLHFLVAVQVVLVLVVHRRSHFLAFAQIKRITDVHV